MENIDTDSVQFKELIKALNFESRTNIETHSDNQEKFKKMMPLFASLTAEEKRSLVHMLQNKSSSERLMEELNDETELKRLAELSEQENHAVKNRYRH